MLTGCPKCGSRPCKCKKKKKKKPTYILARVCWRSLDQDFAFDKEYTDGTTPLVPRIGEKVWMKSRFEIIKQVQYNISKKLTEIMVYTSNEEPDYY